MPHEYEHKLIVHRIPEKDLTNPVRITQGYLSITEDSEVRVRTKGTQGSITVKGCAEGIGRPEYEYEIPLLDALAMIDDLIPEWVVQKVRYRIPHSGYTIEVDVFVGNNNGLILAEIEVPSADTPCPSLPPGWETTPVDTWYTKEGLDPATPFANQRLAQYPFREWPVKPFCKIV